MSQSKLVNGVGTPKDSARTRNANQDIEQHADSHGTAEPACRSRAVGHSVESREWREIAYDERRIVSYRPCAWPECYPNGAPDESEGETVVRSAHRPTVYHRPKTATDSQTDPSLDENGVKQEAVSAITELLDGDRVVWEGQLTPMRVVEPTTDPTGVVGIIGPDGGEYHIEGRPEYPRPYYIRPGYAYQSDLRRVVTDDAHTEVV